MTRIPGTQRNQSGALFVLPSIPDDADETTKNGIAIRNACSVEGRCPSCGTTPELHPDPDYPNIGHLVFMHEAECPVARDDAA